MRKVSTVYSLLGLALCLLPGTARADARLDLTGVDPDLAPAIRAEFHRLSDAYPAVYRDLRYVGTGLGKHARKRYGLPERLGSNSYGATDYEGRWIMLNPAYFGSRTRLAAALAQDRATGWHPACACYPERVLTHEWGHAIQMALGDTQKRLHAGALAIHPGKVVDMWIFTHAPETALGWYAATEPEEAFAEGFVAEEFDPNLCDYVRAEQALLAYLAPALGNDRDPDDGDSSDEDED